MPAATTTNEEVAARLGVGASSVSRMRTGERIGSDAVLLKLVTAYGFDAKDVLVAAESARGGKPQKWQRIFKAIFDGKHPAAG